MLVLQLGLLYTIVFIFYTIVPLECHSYETLLLVPVFRFIASQQSSRSAFLPNSRLLF